MAYQIARSTVAPTIRFYAQIAAAERMTAQAMSFAGIHAGDRITASNILAGCHRFKVQRVDASPVLAEMIDV